MSPSGDVALRKRPDSARPLRGLLSAYALDCPAPTTEDLAVGVGRLEVRSQSDDPSVAGTEGGE